MGDSPVVVCRRSPWDDVNCLIEKARPLGVVVSWMARDLPRSEAVDVLHGAAALMGSWVGGWPFCSGDFDRLGLRLVQLMSAGYDGLDLSVPREADVPVANIGADNATTVAEHAIAVMLASLRQLPAQTALVAAGGWRPAPPARELRDKTVGIVGFGNVGSEIARRVRAFDATVVYTAQRRRDREVEAKLAVAWRPLAKLLAESDVVCLAVSATPQTERLMAAEQLAMMKPDSILVNVSRGMVVDEPALIAALADRRLAGAAIDVLGTEPPAVEHPLRRAPNVILTPHQAGLSPDAWPRIVRHCWNNVADALAGRPIANRVA